ncbi:hypothetical protein ACFQUU_08955 [Herbaspirillum sp. GCM10030257]|uniref:hypothetical protein n=1 Tax=Herbaspirillum sp. GCM10030257 TaxID=3273393 RepID=UPI00360C944F
MNVQASEVETPSDLVEALVVELHKMIGLMASTRAIADMLPVTPITDHDGLCPELIFPVLAKSAIDHAEHSLSLLELLRSATSSAKYKN